MRSIRPALLFWTLCIAAAGCDNVGRAFDPVIDPGEPEPGTGVSTIEVVPVGGDARDGRPKVRAAFPSGGGWPTVVPIVVEFSESLNQATVVPSTPVGTDGRIVLRVRGTTQVLPCQYDFVANGRVLVMRPVTELSNAQNPTYEVVLLPEARDTDGVRFEVEQDSLLLTDFQVNQDASFVDGRILTTFPRDNVRDATRETDYLVFFDRPATLTSVTPSSLRVRLAGGADVAGLRTFPLTTASVPDGRVVRFRPETPLLASTDYELVVDDTITFPQAGTLDFRGRTPFARFETIGVAAPAAVALGNPINGFPNKINQTNLTSAVLHVTTAADAQPGDRLRARIYGGDAATATTVDLDFVEVVAEVPAAGTQTVLVDFGGRLGSLTTPAFDDGSVTFAAQTLRGSQQSGFAHNTGDDEALFDITLPTLQQAGPPSLGSGFDVATDQEDFVFFGVASEPVRVVTLTAGGNQADLFAAAEDGRFLLFPIPLGRRTTPLDYSLTLRDRAGNFADGTVNGRIVQRGVATGAVAGQLTVEAYDTVTLAPIANATVLVDAAAPQLTGTDGRRVFSGLAGADHTVTVVRQGYDLLTIHRTTAAFLSLPLRPLGGATATLQGNAVFTQAPGTTVLVGCSAFDDANEFGVRTANASPTAIPPTPIVPNRPAIVTAFGGAFEPTMVPTFTLQGFQSLGPDATSPTPPLLPPAAGESVTTNLALLPSAGAFGSLIGPYSKDFGLATGLDVGNLVGGAPIVRVASSFQGFGGQVLMGVGFAQLTTGTTFAINANWTQPGFVGLAGFGAELTTWIVADARDQDGRISRHRVLLDILAGTVPPQSTEPQPIPTVSIPSGPFPGAPTVEFVDAADPAVIPGGVVVVDLTAEDATGRRWTLLLADTDAAGGTDTVQFPDLAAAGVTGLASGTWTVRAETRLWLSLSGASFANCVLAERRRAEVAYSRGIGIPFTIQ